MLPQIKKLNNKEFLALVKRPRHMESTDGIQIFDTKEEDESHKSDWHRNIKVMVPVTLLFMIFSYLDCDSASSFI